MSFLGTAKSFVASAVNAVAEKAVMLAADFTPIQTLIMSMFGIIILLGILKKFDKI